MNSDIIVSQDNAIDAAVHWFQLALTGSIASGTAVIAVACFGLMMLGGHLSRRRGIQLVVGCFVIFGASTIASGLVNGVRDRAADAPAPVPVIANAPVMPIVPVQQPPQRPYDPYAGAALPPRP